MFARLSKEEELAKTERDTTHECDGNERRISVLIFAQDKNTTETQEGPSSVRLTRRAVHFDMTEENTENDVDVVVVVATVAARSVRTPLESS